MNIPRHYTLITLDGVKDLKEWGFEYTCRYELVESDVDDSPKYQCIYLFKGKEAVLIAQRKANQKNVKVRLFNLWPGLLNHHKEFGDGSTLCINTDYSISCCDSQDIEKIKK